ncbi:MAG: cytochrome b/b6 domain-containing protein [Clostridia bacterium]|nr:cytochrome b/b6 domain-containing protein [Clostridia bacterium]
MKRKLIAAAILLLGLTGFFTLSASAYLDPTTTTFLFQALAGVVAVVGTAIVIFWRRAKRKVNKMFGIDENKNMEVEDEFSVVDENGKGAEAEATPASEEEKKAEDEEIDFETADE